jgi:hypothetical protein
MTTVTAKGTVKGNATGGTVTYHWVRTDSSGTRTINEPAIVIAPGDTSVHNLVQDQWQPASSGSEQLVITAPGVQSPATQTITQSYVCR